MTFNHELIGIDRNITIQSYCERDAKMNISSNQIPVYLKKLGYYNINAAMENNNFLNNMLKKNISMTNQNINDIIDNIKNSNDYDDFKNNLNHRLMRAIQLSTHINNTTNDNFAFYNDLTLDELVCLGY
jgi:hypothetical protein